MRKSLIYLQVFVFLFISTPSSFSSQKIDFKIDQLVNNDLVISWSFPAKKLPIKQEIRIYNKNKLIKSVIVKKNVFTLYSEQYDDNYKLRLYTSKPNTTYRIDLPKKKMLNSNNIGNITLAKSYNPTTNGLLLSWVNSFENIKEFIPQYSLDGFIYLNIATYSNNIFSLNLTNFTKDVNYKFRILAIDSSNIEHYSNVLNFNSNETQLPNNPNLEVPQAPTGFTATLIPNTNKVNFNWSNPTINNSLSYLIEYNVDGSEWLKLLTSSLNQVVHEFDSNFEGRTLNFRVVALNSNGRSQNSNTNTISFPSPCKYLPELSWSKLNGKLVLSLSIGKNPCFNNFGSGGSFTIEHRYDINTPNYPVSKYTGSVCCIGSILIDKSNFKNIYNHYLFYESSGNPYLYKTEDNTNLSLFTSTCLPYFSNPYGSGVSTGYSSIESEMKAAGDLIVEKALSKVKSLEYRIRGWYYDKNNKLNIFESQWIGCSDK